MNQIDVLTTEFLGKHLPSYLIEMLSNPFLFMAFIMIVGLGCIKFMQKLKNGDIQINNGSVSIIVLVSSLLMLFIATR